MPYQADIITTEANTGFMEENAFIQAMLKVKETDTRGYLGEQDIRWRIHILLWAAKHCLNLKGDFIDCGGGFGFYMAAIYSYLNFQQQVDRRYYMLDSFCGHDIANSSPEQIANHKIAFEHFGSWYEDVVSLHSGKTNLEIIQGYIPETLSQVQTNKIAFMSVDLNCPGPEISCMEYFWDKLVPGAIVVLDDYGFPGGEAQRIAHNEFAQSKGVLIMSSPGGQGIIIKP